MSDRDLVVGLILDGEKFNSGATTVENSLRALGRESSIMSRTMEAEIPRGFSFMRTASAEAEAQMGRFTGNAGKASRGLLELSRGAEDFAVSFGTGGLAGGFRGAANNISQFFAMMHPLGGAIAGLGVAAVSMWLGFSKGAKDAKKDAESVTAELDVMGKAAELNGKRIRENLRTNLDLKVARGDIQSPEDIEKQLRSEQTRLKILEEDFKKAENARQRAKKHTQDLRFGRANPFDFEEIENSRNILRDIPEEFLNGLRSAMADSREQIEKFNKDLALSAAKEEGERRKKSSEGFAFMNKKIGEIEAAREAGEAAERRDRSLRIGGTLNVMGNMTKKQDEQAEDHPLASIATKGSAGAARAIAEAKNQSNLQKAQLDELKKQTDLLKNTSQTAQADVVIESFGSVA